MIRCGSLYTGRDEDNEVFLVTFFFSSFSQRFANDMRIILKRTLCELQHENKNTLK